MEGQKKTYKHKIIAAIGLLVIVLGVFADKLGIGGGLGMGTKQISVIVAGVLILAISLKPCGCCCEKKKTTV